MIVSAAIIPVAALSAAAQSQSALSSEQIRILAAFTDRIIPKDDLGPSASESGATEYINRALGDYLAGEKTAFIEGLEAMDAFARRSQGGALIELTPDKRDAVLTAMESGNAEGFAECAGVFQSCAAADDGRDVRRSLLRRQ